MGSADSLLRNHLKYLVGVHVDLRVSVCEYVCVSNFLNVFVKVHCVCVQNQIKERERGRERGEWGGGGVPQEEKAITWNK